MRKTRWVQEQRFECLTHQIAPEEKVEALRVARERITRFENAIAEFIPSWSLGPIVTALQTLRGFYVIVASTFVTEVGESPASRFRVD